VTRKLVPAPQRRAEVQCMYLFVEGIQYPTARVKLALTGCDLTFWSTDVVKAMAAPPSGLTWPRIHSSPLARGIKTKTRETKLNYIQNG